MIKPYPYRNNAVSMDALRNDKETIMGGWGIINMKRILFAILITAIAASFSLAGDGGFTGEWVVGNDDVKDSGITVSIIMYAGSNQIGAPGAFGKTYNNGAPVILGKSDLYIEIIPVGTMFDFAVNGSKLTGSIIRNENEDPIYDGKINGNTITFTVREMVNGETYPCSYRGTLSDDGIRFEVTPKDGGKRISFMARRLIP